MAVPEELVCRAEEYARRRGLTLKDALGGGVQGIVFAAESQPELHPPAMGLAIKVHHRHPDYIRERNVYRRLKTFGVTTVRDCNVPQLVAYDDELLVIEMTVVSPPFVLDFGGAYLDRAPDFSDEVIAEWRAEKWEQFGPRWTEVQAIIAEFEEEYGIILHDVSPRNIWLED